MDQDEILLDAEERMEKAASVAHDHFQGLRTGRATSGLVDSIRVDYYGSPTPLKQIATISVPEAQQIMIRPFDQGVINDISKELAHILLRRNTGHLHEDGARAAASSRLRPLRSCCQWKPRLAAATTPGCWRRSTPASAQGRSPQVS